MKRINSYFPIFLLTLAWTRAIPAAASSRTAEEPIAPSVQGIWTAIQDIQKSRPDSPSTMEEILARLPEDFRSNFTLMKSSQSIQTSSPEAPRVIMFGKDAKLILAFNGEPSQSGYNFLEMIEYNSEKDVIELRFIEFNGATAKPRLSEVNPSLCTTCHGQGPHYNWTSYNIWPDAYGEKDDKINEGTVEGAAFLAFKAAAVSHPRYSSLIFDQRRQMSPYWSDRLDRKAGNMPNTRLGLLINRRQAVANGRRILNSELSHQDKLKLGFHIFGCAHDLIEVLSGRKDESLDEFKGLLKRFNMPLESYWKVQKSDGVLKGVDSLGMYDGTATLYSLVSHQIWKGLFANDLDLEAFYKPLALAGDIYDHAAGESIFYEGALETLRALDGISNIQISKDDYELLLGTNSFPAEKSLTREDYPIVCNLLKEKALLK